MASSIEKFALREMRCFPSFSIKHKTTYIGIEESKRKKLQVRCCDNDLMICLKKDKGMAKVFEDLVSHE
jgi:hypothetical protein